MGEIFGGMEVRVMKVKLRVCRENNLNLNLDFLTPYFFHIIKNLNIGFRFRIIIEI